MDIQKNKNRSAIGEKIADKRKEARITQIELAERLGIEQATISKVERGRFNASIDLIYRIVDEIGCEIDIIRK